jgi:ABC-type antimicrobial peptide transport system permease subunit
MPIEKNAAIAYSIVINEAAAKSMNMQNPVDEIIKWSNQPLRIIGVIKDMIMESPYEPAKPTIYIVNNTIAKDWVNIRINPNVSAAIAVQRIGNIFKQNISSMPFEYKFVDTEYGLKFRDEERIGRLSTVFAGLAIFISCLGLLGLASFMAAKRKKEIGIRKVLGASLFSVWRLLSGEFVALIFISLLISIPIAYYCMSNWLLNYQYRTEVSWWIFVIAGAGVVIVTLLTVSFQAIKAAVANPVKSLRSE